MKMKIPQLITLTSSLFLFAGCTSFHLSQTNRFINEDGAIITVDYGTGSSDYVTKFRSPMNGNELEFKSKLRVRVTMPDGESFYAFECFNELKTGTLYRSGDEDWSYHAKGIVCTVYNKNDQGFYAPVFEGVMCQSPARPRKEQRR